MDDETYCACDPSQVPGNEYYNIVGDQDIERDFKVKRKQKFGDKFLIWQAIAENVEVSEPYVTKGTINKDIYLEECVKRRLIPFISKSKENHNVLFWPDLATSHYAKCVKDYLVSENVDFVQNEIIRPMFQFSVQLNAFWLCVRLNTKKWIRIITL